MNIEAFFKITYGLYIVGSKSGDKINAHISNTVMQVTAEPAKFVVCSHKDNLTADYVSESGVFSAAVIQQDVDLDYIGRYGFKSGRDYDKFEGVDYKIGKTGAPIVLEKTIAFIECEVEREIDVGTHIMFIGKVVDSDILTPDKPPLTYDYYRDVIKGLSPKNAPTYVEKYDEPDESEKTEESGETMENEIYICTVCGYEYDPDEGDPTAGIPPGTPFSELPEDWVCPICEAGKEQFIKG